MATHTTCDACGERIDDEGLSLTDDRSLTATFGYPPANGDFHDEDCLIRFLTYRADQRRKRES